jgi:chemotaxis protein MotA
MLALEERVNDLDDAFLKKGIMLVVDGTDPELVKNIMEAELGSIEGRHQKGVNMVEMLATFAPAFGMCGTVIGLVIMLLNLDFDDPTAVNSLGANMSMALITTLYGAMFANILFIPIAGRLRLLNQREIFNKTLICTGLLMLMASTNANVIKETLYEQLNKENKKNMGQGKASRGGGDE